VLDLLAGRDHEPLVPFTPPRVLVEETSWDEPVAGVEPLGFALRGLLSRLSARLQGRGEAAAEIKLTIHGDRGRARFRGVPAERCLRFTLAKPMSRESDLRRVLGSRLERTTLDTPSLGLHLEATRLTEAVPRQLELESLLNGTSAEAADELPLVVAELCADLGEERVGVLGVLDSHRPEQRSQLGPVFPKEAPSRTELKKTRPPRPSHPSHLSPMVVTKTLGSGAPFGPPTRLFPEPVEFEAPLRAGATLGVDRRLYVIESVSFEARLEAVEWWSHSISRDYVRLTLRGSSGVWEALAFVDRETNRRYLQGVLD
jgi:protein ImuB